MFVNMFLTFIVNVLTIAKACPEGQAFIYGKVFSPMFCTANSPRSFRRNPPMYEAPVSEYSVSQARSQNRLSDGSSIILPVLSASGLYPPADPGDDSRT